MSTLKRWSASDAWQARAREHDLAVQGEASKRAIEREADQRVEISLIVEDIRDAYESAAGGKRKGPSRSQGQWESGLRPSATTVSYRGCPPP
jgi:hypothetical protein